MNRSSIAVLFLVATNTVSIAAEQVEEVGGWKISTRPQQAGAEASPHCVLASPVDGKQPRFWLSNKIDDRDGNLGNAVLQLVLDTDKSMTPGGRQAQIEIPGQQNWTVSGQVSARESGVVVTFSLPTRIDEATRYIRRGMELTFTFEQDGNVSGDYTVPLKGSGRAGQALMDCLVKVVPAI